MDRSIIGPARERARMAEAVTGTRLGAWPQAPHARTERGQTHSNAANPHSHPQRGLATGRESNVYLACGLLFAMGVLLALSGGHVAPHQDVTKGGACHGQL